MYLNDSDGKKSLTATLSIIAFVIVMIKVLLNNTALQFGSFSYSFGSMDATEIAAILSPILGTYAFRRYTDKRYAPEETGESTLEEGVGADLGSKPGDGAE